MRTSPPDLARGRPTPALVARAPLARVIGMLLLILLPSGALPAEVDADAAGPATGSLVLDSDPRGAYAFIDGEYVGITPVPARAVSPGEHVVWFRSRPPVVFEPRPLPEKRVEVAVGETVRVTERMGHLVRIDSHPQGAEVLVGGQRWGTTPLVLRWYRESFEEVRIRRTGYFPEVVSGDQLTDTGEVRVSLRPLDDERIPYQVTMGPRSAGVNWPAWGVLALGATSAALAVHYKDEADDAFAGYEDAADPGLQEDLLDRANRYDRYSSVAWIAAEGSFLLSLWLFASHVFSLEEVGVTPIAEGAPDRMRMGVAWSY